VDDRQQQARAADAQYRAGEVSRLELELADQLVVSAELATFDARVKALQTAARLEDAMQSPAAVVDWVVEAPMRGPDPAER